MSNITFATRTAAVYADKRVRPLSFTNADYPVRELIQPALDQFDLDLDADYAGTSTNPFMVESFTAAIQAEKLDVFVQMPYNPSRGRTTIVAERFGLDGKVMEPLFDGVYEATRHMAEEDRLYYLATMLLTAEAFNLSKVKTTRATGQIIASAVRECQRGGQPVLFSGAKMTALYNLHAKLMQAFPRMLTVGSVRGGSGDAIQVVYKTLGRLAAFNTAEITRLLADVDPRKYALVGQVKVGFGCKDLDATMNLITTTHERLLIDMLPSL